MLNKSYIPSAPIYRTCLQVMKPRKLLEEYLSAALFPVLVYLKLFRTAAVFKSVEVITLRNITRGSYSSCLRGMEHSPNCLNRCCQSLGRNTGQCSTYKNAELPTLHSTLHVTSSTVKAGFPDTLKLVY